MTYKTAFNPGDSPVVVDAEGRTIGGGEWDAVSSTEDAAKAGFDSGALVAVDADPEGDGLNPNAQAALQRTASLNARHSELQGLDVEELRKAATKGGVVDEGDKSSKTELLSALVRRPDVQVGSPKKTAAARGGEKES
jgi:hypothetical protein